MKPAKCLLILLCFGFVFFLVFGGSPPRATASSSQEGTLDPIRRALLIGIGKYQSLPRLPGSKNDIEMVRQVLLTKYGFPEQHMRILKDEAATRAGVLAALRQLVQETGHQDVVYIHYSGHGSQVEDLNGDEPDDQLDETLVPQDGRTEGIPDITDDELEDILSQFKSNKVVVVLDSCHSGTATRGLEVRVRSVPKDTRLSLYKSSGVRSRAIVPLQSTRYLLMSAAASHEEALDGPVDGRYHGFFTYSLFKSLQSAPLSASSNEVFDGAKLELKRIQNQFGRTSMPEPQAEASLKRLSQPLFEITGSTEKGKNLKSLQARRPWVTVHPLGKDQVLLSHAVSLGALQESVWGLYSQQEVDFHPGNVKAFARVIQTQGIDAIAIIEPPGADIFQNARAILIAPAPQSDSIPVHLRNVAPESRAWLKKELTKRLGDVKIVGAGEFARFVVDVKGKTLHVYSADAAKEVASTPISQSGESIDPLAQVIIQSRNASNLLGLENPNSQIKLDVRIVQVSDRGIAVVSDAMEAPQYHIRRPGEPRTLTNSLQLEILTDQNSYITVVDVDAEGNVNLLFPNPYQKTGFYPDGFLHAHKSLLIPDSLGSGNRAGFHWDYADPPGVDTIRVFATTERHLAERIRQTLKSSRNDGPGTSIFGQPVTKLASLRRELFGSITRGLITVPDQPGSNPNHLSIQSPGKVAEQAKQGLPPTQLTGMDLPIPDWTAVSVTVLVSQ